MYKSKGATNMDAGSYETSVNFYQIARHNTPHVYFNLLNLRFVKGYTCVTQQTTCCLCTYDIRP